MGSSTSAIAQNRLFLKTVDGWVGSIPGNINGVLRKVLFELAAGVIRRTPVDTGRLKGNWQFSVASPSAPPSDALDLTPVRSSDGPTEKGIAAQVLGAEAGTVHYVVNGLPYAPVIEYGLYGQVALAAMGSGGKRGPRGLSTAPREHRAVEREKDSRPRTVGGFSTQAPQGMVRVTIAEYKRYVSKAAAEVNKGAK